MTETIDLSNWRRASSTALFYWFGIYLNNLSNEQQEECLRKIQNNVRKKLLEYSLDDKTKWLHNIQCISTSCPADGRRSEGLWWGTVKKDLGDSVVFIDAVREYLSSIPFDHYYPCLMEELFDLSPSKILNKLRIHIESLTPKQQNLCLIAINENAQHKYKFYANSPKQYNDAFSKYFIKRIEANFTNASDMNYNRPEIVDGPNSWWDNVNKILGDNAILIDAVRSILCGLTFESPPTLPSI
jgi:hypothetical protein